MDNPRDLEERLIDIAFRRFAGTQLRRSSERGFSERLYSQDEPHLSATT